MRRARIALLLLGDIVALYCSLFVVLLIRYRGEFLAQFLERHVLPFSVVFLGWIVVFFIAGLYDARRLRNNLDFVKTLALTISVNALVTVLFFYLIPAVGIAPKTNLFGFIAVFALLEVLWRRAWNRITAHVAQKTRVILIGGSATTESLADSLGRSPQLGYTVALRFTEDKIPAALDTLGKWENLIRRERIELIVVPHHLKNDSSLSRILYHLLAQGVEVHDTPSFYETVVRKVPLEEVNEGWFLENVSAGFRFYDGLKRAVEFTTALVLAVVLLPLEILIAILVKLSSPGPVAYKQVRVGKNGKEFTLYKFRDMRVDAEKDGAQWKTSGTHDPRLTWVGRILVPTHLDELLQLINILKGEMSFVGPRPERPEFVKVLENEIPFYQIRHLVNPGIAGWAQINYRYGASVEDAKEKLTYDIYYIKNRSVILDLAIVLKTIKSLFINQR